jgi:hypothetical protein
MTTNNKADLFFHFRNIVDFAAKHGLSDEFFDQAESNLAAVTDALNLTVVQAALFALLLEYGEDDAATIGGIARSIGCGRIEMFAYMDDFEVLERRGFICAVADPRRPVGKTRAGRGLPAYIVPLGVIKALRRRFAPGGAPRQGPERGARTSPEGNGSSPQESFFAGLDNGESLKEMSAYQGLIPANTIKAKRLFYSEKTTRRVAELKELLIEKNFAGVRKRLAEKNMRTGFACLFSGPPGTGKTETAYQIAGAAARNVMLVDASEIKDRWFGESEKRVKELFDRYHRLVKGSRIAPILLFNEADAVLGKRQTLGDERRGCGQTENAIQNIILQEMENLEGILIATTNMTGNLDQAFERRFLYKIEFEKPDLDTKKAIWQSIMPELDRETVETLSRKFDFSGGQIENVARKEAVSSILSGAPPLP